MGLFRKLMLTDAPDIDWEMTPEYTFGTFESWGGKERVRSKNERIYYFFIDGWDEPPKLCLMERGIKHARVVAEILAPAEMVAQCVSEQGKVAFFERPYPIKKKKKKWLVQHVIESDDDALVVPMEQSSGPKVVVTGLPKRTDEIEVVAKVWLPEGNKTLSEEAVGALVAKYNFPDQERNPQGSFPNAFIDNGDGLTISDRVTGLMWQRGGTDIMSYRSLRREVERINKEKFAGFSDWRMPSVEEAMSLLEKAKLANDQYLHQCFSIEQPFVFADSPRTKGGYWFVDYKQGRAFWASGTIPGGFGRLCRSDAGVR